MKNVEVSFPADYCTISGKNNSGKSAIVRIIQHFLEEEDRSYFRDDRKIQYSKDTTLWSPGRFKIGIEISLHRDNDAELYFVTERLSKLELKNENVRIRFETTFEATSSETSVFVDEAQVTDRSSALEIIKKYRSAPNLIIHNSTNHHARYYYSGEDIIEFFEGQFLEADRERITKAQASLQKLVQSAAKKHKDGLSKYIGRLNESYDVELTPPEANPFENIPLSVKLKDKSVEAPLREWGAGTQNRTRALISIFGAARAREAKEATDRVTAVVIIEEPESFLHPSAQADFGRILNQLSSDFSIQIIATTHSPYMLNQTDPSANILLDRVNTKGTPRETRVVDTSGDSWMQPFAENLGIVPSDFRPLADLFGRDSTCVVLVEGESDKAYFELARKHPSCSGLLPEHVEIVPYGGTGALSHTILVKFVLSRFKRVFVTFDKDAELTCKPSLEKLGLIEGRDFCAVGIDKPGLDKIEGLTPERIRLSAISQDSDVTWAALGSTGKEKSNATAKIKARILDEFKNAELSGEDMKEFRALLRRIGKAFTTKN